MKPTALDAADTATARYAQALRYPLQLSPILTLALLAIGRIVASSISFFGYALHFIVWLALYRFAYEVLASTANGRAEAPETPAVVEHALAESQVWLQAVLLAGSIVIVGMGGPVFGALAALPIGAALPALLIGLTVDRNTSAAVNASAWADIVRIVGSAEYVSLAVPCVLMLVLQTDAAALIPATDPRLPGIVAYYTLAHFLAIATFHLIGLTLFRHRDALGFESEAAGPLRDPAQVRAEEQLDAIDAMLADGDIDGALAALRSAVTAGASMPINLRYREVLVERQEHGALVAHARVFVGQLLATGAERQALALVAETFAVDARYVPAQVADTERLVAIAERLGLHGTAVELARNYARANGKRRDGASLAIAAARLLAERLDRRDEARALLAEIRAQARDPEAIESLERASRTIGPG